MKSGISNPKGNVIDFLKLCLTRVSGYAGGLSVSQRLRRTVWVTYKSIYLIRV